MYLTVNPSTRLDGRSQCSRTSFEMVRSASRIVGNTSGDDESHLRMGNPFFDISAVTSTRIVTACGTLTQEV